MVTIISLQLGHNASALLLKNGIVLGAISQEKFDNIKNSSNFPKECIDWLLHENNLKPEDIDYIAISGLNIYPQQTEHLKVEERNATKIEDNLRSIFIKADYTFGFNPIFKEISNYIHYRKAKTGKRWLINKLKEIYNIDEEKILFVEHHVAHSYSPVFFFKHNHNRKKLVFTLDGSGDYYCATVNIYQKGKMKRIASTEWRHSLGYIYSKTTSFLGMKPLEHEYKVMGLAPYAKEYYLDTYNRIFKNIINVDEDNLTFVAKFPTNRFDEYLQKNAINERFDNIAAAVQKLTEELVIKWIKTAIKKYNIHEIMTSGGVFMNVKLNKKIQELPEVEKVYFMPSSGDESNVFGAAYYIHTTKSDKEITPIESMYLGPKYQNQKVEEILKTKKMFNKYKIKKIKDIEKEIARLLSLNYVVARVKGKAEYGARSLGNRSILANPSNMDSFFKVNDQIKMRDFWMPFAPSILEEDQDKYIVNNKKGTDEFMITTFDSTNKGKKYFKASIHQADKTLRAQIVKKSKNPEYHRLIEEFKKLTGIGGVLNTSLNIHGYPLAATIEQALFTFENSGLKYIAIENYLISK